MPLKRLKYTLCALSLILTPNITIAADEPAVVEKTPEYVSLGDPMVLNLSNSNRKLSFLQLKADVLVMNNDAKALVKSHIPAIRHQLIVLLSEQSASDMKTPAKRELVRQQASAEIREMMDSMADTKDVEEVLFSTFLVQ